MSEDLYQILGVTPTASRNEIKAAYRDLVKRHHPDTGGDESKILAINAAWEILKNKETRTAYTKKQERDRAPVDNFKGCKNAGASWSYPTRSHKNA